ncbi:redoxin domain-containing protein [Formosa sp. S-31]|uniref:redoxin domain-containing protein n=1 Tax=Formosa sp. S-31 TaxID=2790949 RepID=UPI003EBDCCDE
MIKRFALLGAAVLAFSCAKDKNSFALTASLNEAANGKTIKLFRMDGQNNVLLDSTTVTNGKAVLEGGVTSPDIYFINIDQIRGTIPVIIENEDMTVDINTDSIMNTRVKGSQENKVFNAYQDYMKGMQKRNQELSMEFRSAQQKKDTTTMANIQAEFEELVKASQEHDLEFMKLNNDAVVSALILERAMSIEQIPFEQKQAIYDNFTEELKNTRAGKAVGTTIKAVSATAIGSTVENFSAPDTEGKSISLYDVKGKVTIIDFWASWCGPCRRENPNLVKLYGEYHDKGLEILSISLDGTPRQKDAKAEWLRAIKKDSLTWKHMSNLAYFNDPLAKQFNIRAIPATIIIDANGKIVAKDLRGPQLDAKIAELLD